MVDIISEVSCYAAFGKRVQPAASVYDCTHRSTSAGKCLRAGKTQIAKASHQLYFARRQSAKVWILALSFYSMSCKVYR
jgi:hypothetical protein